MAHYDNLRSRDNAFLAAFGKAPQPELPTPHLGTTFRWNNTKVASLSFSEKMSLQEYDGTSYRDLPAWIRDGGFAVPSHEEAKHQRDTERATGYTQTERNAIFSAATADAEYLVALTQSETLRDSRVLDNEIAHLSEKYGSELTSMVNDVSPEAAAYLHNRQRVKAAEQKAANETTVADELRAAKAAIEAMNGNPLAHDAQIRGEDVN